MTTLRIIRSTLVPLLIGLGMICGIAAPGAAVPAETPIVLEVRLQDESITPVTARFIERAMRQARAERVECVVIVLDTPGGLVDSTRGIIKTMLQSDIPIVVYVAPPGARAASAGVFITLAGHVAAMAPGTNIGAAHPVQIGGLPIGPSPPAEEGSDKGTDRTSSGSTVEEKVLNDTVAWARALAELRGRNADWATRAVKESLSVSASEALAEGVIDLVAQDVDELLRQLDGRTVRLPRGDVQLQTAQSEVRQFEMWWGEQFLNAVSNPNVAFLLLIFGFYGILFELYTPGWGVAGTLGIVCLVMAFFALAVLPISYVGLALVVLALALFVAEAFVTSYGFLTAGGLVCLVIGGLMLVDSPVGFQRISLWVLVPVASATALVTFVLLGSIVKTHRTRNLTGNEALIGQRTRADADFTASDGRHVGVVHLCGELWNAASIDPVRAGQLVEIEDRDGLTLRVRPIGSVEHGAAREELLTHAD